MILLAECYRFSCYTRHLTRGCRIGQLGHKQSEFNKILKSESFCSAPGFCGEIKKARSTPIPRYAGARGNMSLHQIVYTHMHAHNVKKRSLYLHLEYKDGRCIPYSCTKT